MDLASDGLTGITDDPVRQICQLLPGILLPFLGNAVATAEHEAVGGIGDIVGNCLGMLRPENIQEVPENVMLPCRERPGRQAYCHLLFCLP